MYMYFKDSNLELQLLHTFCNTFLHMHNYSSKTALILFLYLGSLPLKANGNIHDKKYAPNQNAPKRNASNWSDNISNGLSLIETIFVETRNLIGAYR